MPPSARAGAPHLATVELRLEPHEPAGHHRVHELLGFEHRATEMLCDSITHVGSTHDGAHEGRLAERSDDVDERREVYAFDVQRRHGHKVTIAGRRVNHRRASRRASGRREAFAMRVVESRITHTTEAIGVESRTEVTMATKAEQYRGETERSGPKKAKRARKARRDEPVDTARPGVSATARKVGAGSTAARNASKRAAKKATAALEDSARARPSRKSTRKSKNRAKQASNLTRRATRETTSPKARARRATAKRK